MPDPIQMDLSLTEDVRPSLSDTLATELERAVPTPVPTPPGEGASPSTESASLPRPTESSTPKPGGEPGQRARDEKGRFATAAPAAAPPTDGTAPAAAPQPGGPENQPAAAPAAEPRPEDSPPASWKDDQKAHWASVPPEVRGYLHQREGELQQGFQKVAQRANVAEAVLSEFTPYAEVLQAEGANPITAMRTLLQTAHALRTGAPEYKKAIIMSLAQQYGIDMSAPLNAELAQAQAEAAQYATERMYGQTAQQQQEIGRINNLFAAFASDPANEFFPQVRPIMAKLISGGLADTLQDAYQMAVGMHPEVRGALVQREVASRAAAVAEDNKRRAAANLSVTGAPGGANMASATPVKDSDLRATLEKAFSGNTDRM